MPDQPIWFGVGVVLGLLYAWFTSEIGLPRRQPRPEEHFTAEEDGFDD